MDMTTYLCENRLNKKKQPTREIWSEFQIIYSLLLSLVSPIFLSGMTITKLENSDPSIKKKPVVATYDSKA